QETFSRYIKVGSSNQTLAFRLSTGWLNGEARRSEQFWVGGSETLRGYDPDEFVGHAKLVANAEYRFPIADQVQGVFFVEDRKSTRLNSSHVKSSYAVFCLK